MNILSIAVAFSLAFQGSGFSLRIPNMNLAPKADAPVAKVGDVVIKAQDIEALLWESRGSEVLNDIIAYQLVKQEADRQGAIVTEAEVSKATDEYLKSLASEAPADTDISDYLARQGITPSRLYLNLKTEQLLNKLAKLKFQASRYVKVSTILSSPASNATADQKVAEDKIRSAHSRIKKGEKWETVAAELISDPQAKRTGGLLGWRSLDAFPPLVRTALLNLKVGEFTEPGLTEFGWQFFRLELQGADAVKEEVEDLYNFVLNDLKAQIVREIQAKTKVEKIFGTKSGANN